MHKKLLGAQIDELEESGKRKVGIDQTLPPGKDTLEVRKGQS